MTASDYTLKRQLLALPRVPQVHRCEMCGSEDFSVMPEWRCLVRKRKGYQVRYTKLWTLCGCCANEQFWYPAPRWFGPVAQDYELLGFDLIAREQLVMPGVYLREANVTYRA